MLLPTFFPVVLLVLSFSADVSTAKKARFLTYNVQLSNENDNNPNWTLRRDPIIDQLRHSDADVICLQEIWFSPDMATMMKELKDLYPYSFSSAHIDNDLLSEREKDTVCDPIEMAIFFAACQNVSDIACANVTGFYQRRLCRMRVCMDFVLNVDPHCRYCTSLV